MLVQQAGEHVGDVVAPDAALLLQGQDVLLDEPEQGVQLVAGVLQEADQSFQGAVAGARPMPLRVPSR